MKFCYCNFLYKNVMLQERTSRKHKLQIKQGVLLRWAVWPPYTNRFPLMFLNEHCFPQWSLNFFFLSTALIMTLTNLSFVFLCHKHFAKIIFLIHTTCVKRLLLFFLIRKSIYDSCSKFEKLRKTNGKIIKSCYLKAATISWNCTHFQTFPLLCVCMCMWGFGWHNGEESTVNPGAQERQVHPWVWKIPW